FEVETQGAGEIFPHPWHVRGEFGTFGANKHVDVRHLTSSPFNHLPYATEQGEALCAMVRFVRIGKVSADVTQCGGAQQRVHHSVDDDVSVRVTVKPHFVIDLDASKDQPPTG